MATNHGLTDVRLLTRLVEMSVTLNSTLEPGPLLRFLLITAAELLDCEKTSILIYDDKRSELNFMAATGPEADKLAGIPVPLDGSLAGTIFRNGETLIINDVAKDPRHFGAVAAKTGFQTKSLLGVPMQRREHTTGVLEAINKLNGDFSENDARVLAIVASQAAVAIHNAQLMQELRQVDKIKTNFMHLASHELRTPLAIIMSYAEFLRQDAQGKLSEHAGRVLEAATRQRGIIESMVNMSQLQMGMSEPKLESLSLQAAVQSSLDAVRALAEAKQQRLELSLPADAITVHADPRQLPLVIITVLDNAIRFTPAGGTIAVSVFVQGAEAVVAVRDSGVGIPASELSNIFKDFYQVQDHMTRRHGGLGLGLAMAHDIVSQHGGRIWAFSDGPNLGATFQIVLPRVS